MNKYFKYLVAALVAVPLVTINVVGFVPYITAVGAAALHNLILGLADKAGLPTQDLLDPIYAFLDKIVKKVTG